MDSLGYQNRKCDNFHHSLFRELVLPSFGPKTLKVYERHWRIEIVQKSGGARMLKKMKLI